MSASKFVWYELMTTDIDAAEAFYASVVGWTPQPWGAAEPRYTLMKVGEVGCAGLMPIPADVAQAGGRPGWFGYLGTHDIDAAVAGLQKAGGGVHRPPSDIPEIGRFAVVADPQGAVFMFMEPKPGMTPPPPLPPGTPGTGGWHELLATDWETAWDFYSGQFGWTKDMAVDMGPMGLYQTFAADGAQIGGLMTKPERCPKAVWQYYFHVAVIDAAAERVKAGGGTVANGPMEVPGSAWIVNCVDPQGAAFSLVAPAR